MKTRPFLLGLAAGLLLAGLAFNRYTLITADLDTIKLDRLTGRTWTARAGELQWYRMNTLP